MCIRDSQRTITEDRRMRTLEGIRYLINLDSAEIQQNFAGGVADVYKRQEC